MPSQKSKDVLSQGTSVPLCYAVVFNWLQHLQPGSVMFIDCDCMPMTADAAALGGAVPEGGFKHPRTKCKIKEVMVPVATKGK